MEQVSLPDQVRVACAWVAERGASVRIEEEAIEPYAAGIRSDDGAESEIDEGLGSGTGSSREARAAFAVCLNAINFGSGWWPTIRKRPGMSGFFTIATGLRERFVADRPWSAADLTELTLAAADVARAGVAELRDLDRLTAFADNLVPHVLRLDPALTARIEAGGLLDHGSAAEVELRACSVHAVELLVAARAEAGGPPLTAAEINSALWNRGREPRYKAVPRPRSRNTAY